MHGSARLSVLAAVVTAAAPCFADEQAAQATALFLRGRELVKAGDDRKACPLFEQSLQLAPALGTKLNLALCWAKIGKLVAAHELFEVVAQEANDAGQPQRVALAREGLAALDQRLPKLTIQLRDLPPATEVQLDGKPVAVDHAIAIDPGEHRIDAPGARSIIYRTREGTLGTLTVDPVPRLPRPREVWIAGGAAAGMLVLGTATGIATLRERNTSKAHCRAGTDPEICDQRGLDLLRRAHELSSFTTGAFAVGLALAATAVVFELRSRDERLPPIVVSSTSTDVTVGVAGAW